VVPEGGEATGVLVLMLRHEQPLAAACARVHTRILDPPVLASEWPLGTFPLSDVELRGGELGLEVLLPLSEVLSNPFLVSLSILEFTRRAVLSQEKVVSD
jgi:hypothetical protein